LAHKKLLAPLVLVADATGETLNTVDKVKELVEFEVFSSHIFQIRSVKPPLVVQRSCKRPPGQRPNLDPGTLERQLHPEIGTHFGKR
jgi:hypothetical protein